MKRIQKLIALLAILVVASVTNAADKKPNIVMLMTDDTGWNDFGAYWRWRKPSAIRPRTSIAIAKEGAVFTSWYGQASCTAGRASFITGRIPIRSALSVVVVPGDENWPDEGDADDRRVLPEERLHDLLLGQVASGRQARVLPDRTWLR